ncbi:hypothetical protein IGI37_002344 [Enterococcus sp. AZ194]|uniref:TetR/AcrR family transcriptional regulator n=1 Tax=Enterococcus sp. AZ194 TaxID=2774629 RepID=UPI003F29830F
MNSETYHHGNLKQTLIESGIVMINEVGVESLSLRKVAKKCGVSNAAPYAHFKNKEIFLNDIQSYIEKQFVDVLKSIVMEHHTQSDLLLKIGEGYVFFFIDNPHYYYFLFSRENSELNFSLKLSNESSIKPLEFFKKISLDVLSKSKLSREDIQNKFIAMWSLVHGLASIAIMPNQTSDIDWKSKTNEIIQSISMPYHYE